MRFAVASSLSAVLAPAMVSASTIPRDFPSSFQVYGYGDGIGGLPIFSAGHEAYIGNYKSADNDEAAPVIFTPASDAWLASPNTTETDRPTWSNYKFAIPAASSSSDEVTFVDNDTNDVITDAFTSYGSVVLVTGGDGSPESNWYAVPTQTEGVYALKWDKGPAGGILLTLKATAPSTESPEV